MFSKTAVLATVLAAEAAGPLTAWPGTSTPGGRGRAGSCSPPASGGLSNHLTPPQAAWRSGLPIAWRRVNRRDPGGRGTAGLAGYGATSPDALTT
jgi:hypothetical protein